ncbi:MAG: RNA 2',3'-cyclic phosphodiesterase [Nanoarchaeota archaeon]|nr:RNA 2',3'-cyclic phosphodiesterase [Nanoarchaeota archaeon]MBU1135345.1 RNA 2',3'-cyclic phosphodiesterase [Nanoarchaeota archaeon]MBU2519709.1 RNA 2',3'-cyclic phosphodiesterase [Nanoarchaeota archaeon]
MRLFIAVDLDDNIKEKIIEETIPIRSKGTDIAFTTSENLHVTMKFLGEVAEQQLKGLKEDISNTLAGVKQFKINIKGMGYFGRPEFMKVIWLGVDKDNGRDELVNIIKSLNNALKHIRTEDHDPHPHITIGRVKTCKNKEILLHEVKSKSNLEIGEMLVKQIVLKKSELSEKGPIYTDLMTINLEK